MDEPARLVGLCYIRIMVSAAAKTPPTETPPTETRTMGRPTKFTPELVDTLLRAFEDGCPDSVACLAVNIGISTYQQWRRDKRGFAAQVDQAKAQSHQAVIGVVQRAIKGNPCQACEYGVLDGRRCPACEGSGFSTKPNGRLGLTLLARRLPDEYGDKSRVRHSVSGRVETAVQVSGGVTVAHVALGAVDPTELLQLAWSGTVPQLETSGGRAEGRADADVIDADEG